MSCSGFGMVAACDCWSEPFTTMPAKKRAEGVGQTQYMRGAEADADGHRDDRSRGEQLT